MRVMIPVLLITAVVLSSGCISLKEWPPESVGDCSLMEANPGMYSGSHTAGDCYFHFAAADGNLSLCDEIDITDTNLKCIATVAGQSEMYSVCSDITGSVYRHNCFYNCWDDCSSSAVIKADGQEVTVNFGRIPGEIGESECTEAIGDDSSPIFGACTEIMSKAKADPSICGLSEGNDAAVCRYFYSLYYVDSEVCASLGNNTYSFGSQTETIGGSITMGETHYLGSFSMYDCMEIISAFGL
ncbi:MAG: hypothetical protein JW789_00180 [Candidatus Aenigmarchaeota archaeon]|nr:hypothetical protein [Candidatus Aenigmarchaeota archaeon]